MRQADVARSQRSASSGIGAECAVATNVVARGTHHIVQIRHSGHLVAGAVGVVVGARRLARAAVSAQEALLFVAVSDRAAIIQLPATTYQFREGVVVKLDHSNRASVAERQTRARQIALLCSLHCAVGVAEQRDAVHGSAVVAAFSLADIVAIGSACGNCVSRQTVVVPQRCTGSRTRIVARPKGLATKT